jgi:hypothetical protein
MSQPTTATSAPSMTPMRNPAEVLRSDPSQGLGQRENPEHTRAGREHSGSVAVLGFGDLRKATSMKVRPRSRPADVVCFVPGFSGRLAKAGRFPLARLRLPSPPKRTGQGEACQRHVAGGEAGKTRLGPSASSRRYVVRAGTPPASVADAGAAPLIWSATRCRRAPTTRGPGG